MIPIGAQLRELREEKRMSLRDVARKTGLQHGHISHVERGWIIPSLQTLQRFASAFDMPLYTLFCERVPRPALPHLAALEKLVQQKGNAGKEARFLLRLGGFLVRIPDTDRGLFLSFANSLAARDKIGHKASPFPG
jgi:transcriptional regulator with XRE-family HTH domain